MDHDRVCGWWLDSTPWLLAHPRNFAIYSEETSGGSPSASSLPARSHQLALPRLSNLVFPAVCPLVYLPQDTRHHNSYSRRWFNFETKNARPFLSQSLPLIFACLDDSERRDKTKRF